MSTTMPGDLPEQDLARVTPEVVLELADRGGALLEGALELLDGHVVVHLREALWEVSQDGTRAGRTTHIANLYDRQDEDLQEYAAAILANASEKIDLFQSIRSMGSEKAEDLVLRIEDWETRYQVEEGRPA